MQLTTARLCLNCDEVHDAYACPVCASETFVYLTRWVPHSQPEGRPVEPARVPATVAPQAADGGGALSLIGVVLYQCFKRTQARVELLALRKAGELR